MRILNKTILSGMLLLQMFAICTQASSLKVNHLKCEELVNPLAIDNTTPHFSWQLNSGRQGEQQTAYQVLVASDRERLNENKADLWNSGKVTSSASTWIPYQGKLLAAKSFAYWKVRIWNKDGEVSEWSTPASFGIGLLSPQDWKAQYIGINNEDPQSPLLRKTFEWNKKGDKMLLHVNSLGYHEVYLNGSPVSDIVLTPAVSQFNRRSLSVTYDITNSLRIGKNELVIWLGKGWYQDQLPGVVKGGPFGRAQLEARNNNAWETFQATDASWLARESGYTSFGTWQPHQFGGEEIHAEKLIALDAVSLNKVSWAPVKVADIPEHTTSPQMVEPNRIQLEFHPLSIEASGDTAWIFDMGTNLTGWTKIKFPPLEKGERVRISYCDFLDKQQFRDNLYEDYYIAAGKEQEVFINKFNYKAYRYLKVSNLKQAPALNDVTAYLIHTDYSSSSSFACSDEDLNAIHDMIQYTLRCLTLGGYMVDCPQIERLGYGGDGNASTPTVQTMFNLAPLYTNWMQAWGDCMRTNGSMPHTAPNPYAAGGGPFWCGFMIAGSWQTYVNYGDARLLERYYPFMQQWLEYVKEYTVDGLLKTWPNTDYRNWYLGDWATPKGIDQTDPRSVDLVNNCFVAVCYQTMAKIAQTLGKPNDQKLYESKTEQLRTLIHKTFYDSKEASYGTGTQIDLVYPMLAGVTPESQLSNLLNTLYKNTAERFRSHLATGLVGIPIITEWCIKNQQVNFMLQMLKKRDYPSYLYMIDNGATTTWEHWNGERSHIHNCYNGIGTWFYQALAGIMPDEAHPGYKHVRISPQLAKGISWVKASKETPYGKILVHWEKKEGSLLLNVTIPANSEATITLPSHTGQVRLNGKTLTNATSIHIPSGNHQIVSSLSTNPEVE